MLTLAQSAIQQLTAELVKIPQMAMNSYDHVMVCHACGKFHSVNAYFISSPISLGFTFPDNSQLIVPAQGCNECRGTKGAIREAWEHGTKIEAYNRAASKIGAKLQEKETKKV